MRRPWPWTVRLALLLALAITVYFGGRYVLSQYYPLGYRESLFQRAAEYQLDPYLVAALIRTESRFRPDATSAQGARGLMQIMPETGEWAAKQVHIPYDAQLLYDPDYNIRLGCWYLATLRRQFGGDMILALAAYNAGHSNVQRWLSEKRWTGEHTTLDQIPFLETRNYVARVLRDHDFYKQIYGSEH